MCLERIHRYLTATVVLIASLLIFNGISEGVYLLWFVVGMLILWGTVNFCPSLFILEKLGLKSCRFKQ